MAVRTTPSEAITPFRAAEIVIVLTMFALPRIFILGFAIFSRKLLEDAFPSALVWIAGFFLLPWTTITYAMMWAVYSDRVYGVEWAVVGLAFLIDLLTWSTVRDR